MCTDATERVPVLSGQQLLPVNNRVGKDVRTKDEWQMNGNSENLASDWVGYYFLMEYCKSFMEEQPLDFFSRWLGSINNPTVWFQRTMISCRFYSFELGWKSSRLVHSSGKNCCDKLFQVVHQLTNFGMWGWFTNAETTDAFEWEASGYWESDCNRGCPQQQPISTRSSFIWPHAKNVIQVWWLKVPCLYVHIGDFLKRPLNLQDVLPV